MNKNNSPFNNKFYKKNLLDGKLTASNTVDGRITLQAFDFILFLIYFCDGFKFGKTNTIT